MKDDITPPKKSDSHNLSISQTTKLAGTIDNLEVTGIQLAMLSNALGLTLNEPDMLPKDLRENPHYMQGCQDLLDYVQSHVESIIGKRG